MTHFQAVSLVNMKAPSIVSSFLLLLFIILTPSVNCSAKQRKIQLNPHNFEATWSSFIKNHNKSYSLGEAMKRKAIFHRTMKMIDRHNSQANSSFQMKLNEFSDLTMSEFKQRMNLKPNKFIFDNSTQLPLQSEREKVPTRASIFDIFFSLFKFSSNSEKPVEAKQEEKETSVDWRARGHVTDPIYQGKCGGCWAIAAVGAAEAIYSIKNDHLKQLSSQSLLDCARKPFYQSNGCEGGFLDDAFSFIMANGLPDEDVYPFIGGDSDECKLDARRNLIPITSYRNIKSEKDLLEAVNKSPVPVAIDADQMSFKMYSSGVYDDPACSKTVNHAVLVVGYDSQSWIIKNSWGKGWGDGGYARIKRGKNMCGIIEQSVAPVFSPPLF